MKFTRSPETESALKMLRECATGSTVTYEEAAKALSVNGRSARETLRRAVNIALREGLVFENEINVGYRRLRDGEIALETGPDFRNRTRRAARKEKAKLGCVRDYMALTEEERAQWNVEAVMASSMELLASNKASDKVAIEVDERLKYSLATDGVLKILKNAKS